MRYLNFSFEEESVSQKFGDLPQFGSQRTRESRIPLDSLSRLFPLITKSCCLSNKNEQIFTKLSRLPWEK